MTLSTTTNKVVYDGNGSTTAFAIPFYFLANDDIDVILRDASDTETIWAHGTQFTVSGAGEQGGGTLTVVTTPTDYTPKSGEKLLIKRVEQYTQPTDLPVAGAFPSATVEQSLDRLTMLTQQLKETLDRAVLVPETDGATSLIADIDSVRANKLAGWAADGSLTTYEPGGASVDSLTADETANLTVGMTTDVDTITYGASVTPDITKEAVKSLTATGNWTLNAPSGTVAGGFVLEVTNSGTVNLTLGTGVSKIASGSYVTTDGAKNILVGTYYPSPARLYVAIHQPS